MAARFPVQMTPEPIKVLEDHSGTTTAGQSTKIMDAKADARCYRIQNLSATETLWINDNGGDAGKRVPGCYGIQPMGYYEFYSPFAISVYADTAIPFSAGRY